LQLIDHLSITVSELESVRQFYIDVLGELGVHPVYQKKDAIGFGQRNTAGDDGHSYISILQSDAALADPARHYCFRAQSLEQVDRFHQRGLSSGGKDNGAPGFRDYSQGYYAAFLIDPVGTRIEAVYHDQSAVHGV